jgi:hypothetical protein
MTTIYTLKNDVYQLLRSPTWQNEVAPFFTPKITTEVRVPCLRMSQLGDRCPRALWYSIHEPWREEPLPPWVRFKFAYGHIVEALAIACAKAAGHEVTGEQDALTLSEVHGHRDCVIDGCVVDVKSSSSLGMDKFKPGVLATQDSFGYLHQLDAYVVSSLEDPLVRVKDKGYIWAISREMGHMEVYEHVVRPDEIRRRIEEYKQIVSLDNPPTCGCKTEADGDSGNIKLGLNASYSNFKWSCFPQLRCFIYARGPRYFARVNKRPTHHGQPIKEIDKEGKIIYNVL